MQSRHSVPGARFVRHGLFPLAIAIAIGFGACDEEDPDQMTGTGTITGTGGATGGSVAGAPGGASGTTAGGATGSGSVAGGSASGLAGGNASGAAGGGADAAVGSPTGGAAGGGAPSGGTTGGTGNTGGGATGGRDAGAGDASVSPTPDGGGGAAGGGACSRDLLKSTVDKYFVALAAHDASMLPLASNAKFTENGETMMIGMGGLWKTAGTLKYQHSALDVEKCMSVSESVVPEGGTDLPVGLRLKLVDGKITEAEHIVVREGDYVLFGLIPFPSNPADISASANRIKWAEPVAAGERTSRADIERWTNKYFRMFPGGGCNLAPNCERRENGGGNFNCMDALNCASGDPPAMPRAGEMTPRLIVVDEELGIGVGFVMFMGHTDFHMMKFRGGTVYAVHAILSGADGPGWP